jgi:hypothetical protein
VEQAVLFAKRSALPDLANEVTANVYVSC